MKKLVVIVLSLTLCLPASGVLVRTEDDQASKELAASLPFMACGFGFREDNSGYWAGSWSLIRNDEVNGAWVLGSIHPTIDYDFGVTYHKLRFAFGPNALDDYYNHRYIDAELKFDNPTQDICLIKLKELVREEDGALSTSVEFYAGELTKGQVLLFGGYGDTGTPEEGSIYGTGKRDGFARVARGMFTEFGYLGMEPNIGYMDYKAGLELAGIGCSGDSGGPVMVEDGMRRRLVGINDQGRGVGVLLETGFEYLRYDPTFFSWMNGIIAANGNAANGAPVANAGAGRNATVGQAVTLDGSASADADGDSLTYAWTLVSAPAGSAAALQDAQSAAPSFTPDKAGSYTVQLVVNDGKLDSAPATVVIQVYPLGDVDAGGDVNARDVQLVINAALHKPTGFDCDVDRDGFLNARDVQLVINAVLHPVR